MSMKVGVISDTHGLLRPEVVEILKGCDCIIHAGDIDKQAVLERLKGIAPLYIVRGNNDHGPWADQLKDSIQLELDGTRFFIVHNKQHIPKELKAVDVIIFGHSHKYFCETKESVLMLNPGSCGRRRFRLPITMAVLELSRGSVQVIPHHFEQEIKS